MSNLRQATCTRTQAEHLFRYDHHRIYVNGQLAVLLTCHWMHAGLETAPEPLTVKVALYYGERHPPVPAEVQCVIDQLEFWG